MGGKMFKFRKPTHMGKFSIEQKLLALCVLSFGVVGCSTFNADTQQTTNIAPPPSSLGNVEYETYLLANELFVNVNAPRGARYAVVGFVPADSMKFNGEDQHPLMMLGHQLEQGLITEATKRGYVTQEFKLSNDIMVSEDSDRVLTRDIERLSALERVDYYITGTLLNQQGGSIVNARIVNVETKEVVAAATRFFPIDLFWEQEQVTSRNGMLYRTEGTR